MTQLTGSEKQVVWAEDIRAAKMAELDELMAKMPPVPAEGTPQHASYVDFMAAVDGVKSEASAAWWIDRRDYRVQAILKQVAR